MRRSPRGVALLLSITLAANSLGLNPRRAAAAGGVIPQGARQPLSCAAGSASGAAVQRFLGGPESATMRIDRFWTTLRGLNLGLPVQGRFMEPLSQALPAEFPELVAGAALLPVDDVQRPVAIGRIVQALELARSDATRVQRGRFAAFAENPDSAARLPPQEFLTLTDELEVAAVYDETLKLSFLAARLAGEIAQRLGEGRGEPEAPLPDAAAAPTVVAARSGSSLPVVSLRRRAFGARAKALPRVAGAVVSYPWRSLRHVGRAIRRMNAGERDSQAFMSGRGALWKARLMHVAAVPISLFFGWGMGQLIDMADAGRSVPGALIPFVALSGSLIISGTLKLINDYLSMASTENMSYDFLKKLRDDLFQRVLRFPQKYFDRADNNAESIASRLSDDTHHVAQKNINIPARTPANMLSIAGGIGMLLWANWNSFFAGGSQEVLARPLALAVTGALIAVMVAYGLVSASTGKKLEMIEEKYQTERADMIAHAQQALSSRAVYLAMGLEDEALSLFERKTARMSEIGKEEVKVKQKFQFKTQLIDLLSTELLITFAIAWSLFLAGVPSVGLITAVVHYSNIIAQGTEGLAEDHAALLRADGGSKDIRELAGSPLDLDHPDAVELGPFSGRIEFRDVSLSYEDGTPALQGVSFVVEPGETVALVGASQAGKSTVLKLISRLYRPDAGQVLVDGVDLNTIKIRGFRSQLAIVPQESGLFDATVERNLRVVKPDATDAEIEATLRSAEAYDFIWERDLRPEKSLAQGLGTNVYRYSGGQQQRIAIARALLRNSPLLLLDEWASALDQVNEKKISGFLNRIRRGRTTIVVDHKLHFDKKRTKIIFMEGGRVVDIGKHRELLQRNPKYAELIKIARENIEN